MQQNMRDTPEVMQCGGPCMTYLKACSLKVLLGGIGDSLLDLGVCGWQDHGHIPLPGLTQHLQPLAGDPIR